MKRLLYEKTYVRLLRVIANESDFPFRSIQYPFWIVEDRTGSQLYARYPRHCGHTPRSLREDWLLWGGKLRYTDGCWHEYLIQNRVPLKFFQRPQDKGRWSYRHMGR